MSTMTPERAKPCEFCGYNPDEAHTPEQMTDEEKISAISLFDGPEYPGGPLRSVERCYELFLHHRVGESADWFADENEKTQKYNHRWLYHPERTLPLFPDNWYGELTWEGRDQGLPDPTIGLFGPKKHVPPTWYRRIWEKICRLVA